MEKIKLKKQDSAKSLFVQILFPCALGLIFTIYVFYPGFINLDSVDQLNQGRQGIFTDMHPPLMAWLWGMMDRIIPGPFGMLLFHNFLFWFGTGIFFCLIAPASTSYLRGIAILLAGLYLPVFLLLSTIYKDVGMATAFLFGSAWLIYARQARSIPVFFVSLLALLYAVGVRHNGIIALIPLVIYAGIVLYEISGLAIRFENKRWIVISLLVIGLLSIMQLTVRAFEYRLTGHETTYSGQQVLIYDLVGISVMLDSVILPEYLLQTQKPTIADLKFMYQPGGVNHIFWGDNVTLKFTQDPKDISKLFSLWTATILDHPKAYFLHRINVFKWSFGLVGEKACYAFADGHQLILIGVKYVPGRLVTMFLNAGYSAHLNFLFRGWIYLAVLTFIVAFSVMELLGWTRNIIPAPAAILAVSSSGWLYGVAYLFISTTCDFRLHYWTVVSAVVCLIVLFLSKIRPSSYLP